MGFPGGSDSKESCSVGDLGLILGLGRFPGEGNDCPLQYSGLENSKTISWGHKEWDRTERLSLSKFISRTPNPNSMVSVGGVLGR